MTLTSKKNKNFIITVSTHKGKVLISKNGFVLITKGKHYGADKITPSVLIADYLIDEKLVPDA